MKTFPADQVSSELALGRRAVAQWERSANCIPQRTMTTIKVQCPKCNGEMAQGFVPDYYQSGIFVGSWHPGHPKKSFWKGTKASEAEGLPIGAFRCQNCGLLEFYADNRLAAQ
jgi:hypothetical protein